VAAKVKLHAQQPAARHPNANWFRRILTIIEILPEIQNVSGAFFSVFLHDLHHLIHDGAGH
jgi:hypothetical protein